MIHFYDTLETRSPQVREAELMQALPQQVATGAVPLRKAAAAELPLAMALSLECRAGSWLDNSVSQS